MTQNHRGCWATLECKKLCEILHLLSKYSEGL